MSDPGGTAHGLNAFIEASDGSTAGALDSAMTEVAKWIMSAAGYFLGHVKMAISSGNRTVTFNLTDLEAGVEHHGVLDENVRLDIRFMAAVVDVDRNELAERMRKALVSNGFKLKNRNIVELG